MVNNVLPDPDKAPAPTETATASKIAGPTAREPCCMASFSATALGNRSRSTRFGASAWAAVCWVARKVPFTNRQPYHDVPRIIHAHHYQYCHHRGL